MPWGNGEPAGPETYDLRQTLQSKYRFYLLNLQDQPYISDSIKVLMVVKPTIPFSDEEKLKLDQYLMHGGRIMFLLDALNAGMDAWQRVEKSLQLTRGTFGSMTFYFVMEPVSTTTLCRTVNVMYFPKMLEA